MILYTDMFIYSAITFKPNVESNHMILCNGGIIYGVTYIKNHPYQSPSFLGKYKIHKKF